MSLSHRSQRALEAGSATEMLKIAALLGLLMAGAAALRALTPVILTLVEIVLGIAQAGVTLLRICGI
jgi:hypothetical protein